MVRWIDGRSRGLWFDGSGPMVPRYIALHWTGGVRDANGVVETLRARGLSIHGVLEPDGTFVQTGSFTQRMAHVGGPYNAASIGIEVVDPGTLPDAGVPRRRVTDMINGVPVTYWDYTPEQYAALGPVLARISAVTGVPNRVAYFSRGVVPDSVMLARRGIIGHYQVSTTGKVDPGTRIMEYLYVRDTVRTGLVVAGAGVAVGLAAIGGAAFFRSIQ